MNAPFKAPQSAWIEWDGNPNTIPEGAGYVQFNGQSREHTVLVANIEYWPWFGVDEKPCVMAYRLAPPATSHPQTYADYLALGMQKADKALPGGSAERKADYARSYANSRAPVGVPRPAALTYADFLAEGRRRCQDIANTVFASATLEERARAYANIAAPVAVRRAHFDALKAARDTEFSTPTAKGNRA